MYLAQVWAVPGVIMPAPIVVDARPPIGIKTVDVEPPGGTRFVALLLQSEGTHERMNAAMDQDMKRLGRVLSRLSFCLLTPFSVFSARLVPGDLKVGDRLDEIVFPGPPPGIAVFEGKIGFPKAGGVDPEFLAGDLEPKTEAAITWFVKGIVAQNSIEQVLFDWIGLESLAPISKGPWRCRSCDADVPTCPECGAGTEGPLAVQTVRDFLQGELAVDRREFNRLYELRCLIAHGGLAMDPEGIPAASAKAARIQDLLLTAIKRRLGWPSEKPPSIEMRGLTIAGVPGVGVSGIVDDPNFYDQPGVFPG